MVHTPFLLNDAPDGTERGDNVPPKPVEMAQIIAIHQGRAAAT